MAGFYGTVSAANHNAFVFDKIYNNRKEMDDSITSDHIFLNRYVLVSYSTNKEYIIKGYYDDTSDTFYADKDFKDKSEIAKQLNYIYQDLFAPNSVSSFYKCVQDTNTNSLTYVQIDSNQVSDYRDNFAIDIETYGRSYDGTVWRKYFDEDHNYKYVLVAELNMTTPSFYIIPDPPSTVAYGPYLDSRSDNLNYYLHMPAAWGIGIEMFDPETIHDTSHDYSQVQSDVSIIDYSVIYQNGSWIRTESQDEQPANIYFNKSGFDKEHNRIDIKTENRIAYNAISSHQKYFQMNDTDQGIEAADTMKWFIHLPAIGNAVAEFWNIVASEQRKFTILTEDQSNINECTVDTGTVLGLTNSIRCYLGKTDAYPSNLVSNRTDSSFDIYSNASGAAGERPARLFNRSIIHVADENSNTRSYYLPSYTNVWTEDTNGIYYKATDGSYRLIFEGLQPEDCADGIIKKYTREPGTIHGSHLHFTKSFVGDQSRVLNGQIASNSDGSNEYVPTPILVNVNLADDSQDSYTFEYPQYYAPIDFNGAQTDGANPHTIYSAIAMVNKLLGVGLSIEDSRDDRTVVGMINLMKDSLNNYGRVIHSKILAETSQLTTGFNTLKSNFIDYTQYKFKTFVLNTATNVFNNNIDGNYKWFSYSDFWFGREMFNGLYCNIDLYNYYQDTPLVIEYKLYEVMSNNYRQLVDSLDWSSNSNGYYCIFDDRNNVSKGSKNYELDVVCGTDNQGHDNIVNRERFTIHYGDPYFVGVGKPTSTIVSPPTETSPGIFNYNIFDLESLNQSYSTDEFFNQDDNFILLFTKYNNNHPYEEEINSNYTGLTDNSPKGIYYIAPSDWGEPSYLWCNSQQATKLNPITLQIGMVEKLYNIWYINTTDQIIDTITIRTKIPDNSMLTSVSLDWNNNLVIDSTSADKLKLMEYSANNYDIITPYKSQITSEITINEALSRLEFVTDELKYHMLDVSYTPPTIAYTPGQHNDGNKIYDYRFATASIVFPISIYDIGYGNIWCEHYDTTTSTWNTYDRWLNNNSNEINIAKYQSGPDNYSVQGHQRFDDDGLFRFVVRLRYLIYYSPSFEITGTYWEEVQQQQQPE